jgi:hypothetical protein
MKGQQGKERKHLISRRPRQEQNLGVDIHLLNDDNILVT